MRPYQTEFFNQGKQSVFDDLISGKAINSSDLIALLGALKNQVQHF